MSPAANQRAVSLAPTLINVPSFAVSAEPPAVTATAVINAPLPSLAPIPEADSTALSNLVTHAAEITATAITPSASFFDDDELDLDIDEFFTPAAEKRDKGKKPVPATPAAPEAPPHAGPSSRAPEFLRRIGFVPAQKPVKRFGAEEHKATRRDLDTLAYATAELEVSLTRATKDFKDGLEGVNAQLVGFAADNDERVRAPAALAAQVNAHTIESLVVASNKLTANSTPSNAALNSVLERIRTLERLNASVTGLQATIEAHDRTIKTLLSRTSASTGSSPPAPITVVPTAVPAAPAGDDHLRAIVQEVLNANGKRARDDVEHQEPAKRQELVALPPSFIYPTPPTAPDFAAAPLAAVALPIAPAPPPASGAASAYPAPPAAPASALPRPLLAVLLGPMDWRNNFHQAPRNLVTSVLGANMIRPAPFKSRKGPDDVTAVLVFEADTVAQWFITTWNDNPRISYEICVARPMPLNA
ncbi:hypothetical protein DFH07DRAFT_1027791 [Mycena maculata]|uniref:Uncharacterized protein n=1 Tax=Mycena maculata TaxID=230809 RepID=A0AAD7NDV0_9AGAR|nr:hypothetical protein DFH07DRAFT_1027791 [Mycena maculata]